MSSGQKKSVSSMRYIYVSEKHNKMLSKMIDKGVLAKKEDGLKLGVALGLTFNPHGELSAKDDKLLSRSAKALNLNSADIDEDQSVTGIISVITHDLTPNNYRRMMELSFIGLEILANKYFDEDKSSINWSKLQEDIS